MDHVLQFFFQLDNLVWGRPLLVLLVRNRDLPNPSFGFASDTLYIFKNNTEDEGHGDISSFQACDSSCIYCRDREYCRVS